MKRLISIANVVALFLSFGVFAETSAPDHSHPNFQNPPPRQQPVHDHGAMDVATMRGWYGPYPMTRDASGTSWVPDASYMEGIHYAAGAWNTMTHGFINAIYDHQGGPRGDSKTFSTSMLMLMAQRTLGTGTLGVRGMVSLDPLMGKAGYPLLFQTGETADGANPLIDRQHPHDLFMELSASYSLPLSGDSAIFAYAGLPGEPALGPPNFMHRLSGSDNPEAPISHHWFDSTHITFGVVTAGYVYRNFKLEGSAFRGREPDQYRYNIETGGLDSSSLRLSYNPTAAWALQASAGRIHSPEALEPDRNVDRSTASAIYNTQVNGDNWQTTFAWSRNDPNAGQATDAYFLESAFDVGRTHTTFARLERVEKNELFLPGDPRHHDVFRVYKLSLGYIYDIPAAKHLTFGLGGLVSGYSIPSDLDSVYRNPASYMIVARLKIR